MCRSHQRKHKAGLTVATSSITAAAAAGYAQGSTVSVTYDILMTVVCYTKMFCATYVSAPLSSVFI